jgi:hypothetical protein
MYFPSDRLAAASENVKLAPHWWQCVAVEPTSEPHAGHSRGLPTFGSERNFAAIELRQRSSL